MIKFKYAPKVKDKQSISMELDFNKHFVDNIHSVECNTIGETGWQGWAVDITDSSGQHVGCLIYCNHIKAKQVNE